MRRHPTTVRWRRRVADVVGVAAIVAGTIAIFPSPAAADEQGRAAAATGWWHRDGDVPLVGGPDVPDGGLYVAADVLGERAIAAIRVPLLEGDRPRSLQLTVASSSGAVGVQVCPTTSSWAATGGMGSYDERPEVDCARGIAAEIRDGRLHADLGTLGAAADVDVALVPAPGATFELTIGRPGDRAVIVDAPEPPTTTTTAPPPPPTTTGVTAPPVPTSRAPVSTTTTIVVTTTTQPVVAPPIPTALPPALPTTTIGLRPPPNASTQGDGTGQRFVAGGTFVALAALWAWLQFGGGARLIEPDHQMGIGRFRHDRPSDSPPRL